MDHRLNVKDKTITNIGEYNSGSDFLGKKKY